MIESEAPDLSDEMIGVPDNFYDEEERKQAYKDYKEFTDRYPEDEYFSIADGFCPECGGSGYMDGDEFDDDGEENSECYGSFTHGCDEGEIENASWADIIKHDKRNAERQQAKANYPGDEEVIKQVAAYMKHMDDPRQAYQQMAIDYPHMGRAERSGILAKAKQIAFPESVEIDQMKRLAGMEESVPYSISTEKDLADKMFKAADERKHKEKDAEHDKKQKVKVDESSDEVMVAKMLAKALGDENRWTEMSAPELYAELESTNPDVADMIRNLAKMLYDVKLEERAYKDVGVADVVKDQRGKEFKFDKNTKKFKSQDGEEADVSTKLGKDLMRLRKNHMKRTSPSYPKKHKVMASIEEAYGDAHEITLEDNEDFNDVFGVLGYSLCEVDTFEAEYQGRKVKLNKPMQGDVKKFKVYVKDPKTGNVKKVNFGHGGSSAKGKTMKIRKSNPKARKSFRARHNCDNPGPKTKARYWSCRKWQIMMLDNEKIFDIDGADVEYTRHKDENTRFMKVIEGFGWKFQYSTEEPKDIRPGTTIHINKNCFHRLIKGNTPLKVRIVEL